MIFVLNRVRVSGAGPHLPTQGYIQYLPRGFETICLNSMKVFSGSVENHALRLPHTRRFFVVELQIFCRDQIGLKFVGPSGCLTLADFLSRQTAFSLGAESISAMFRKRLGHVTLMTISHCLGYARALTNCLGLPRTSRQGPTRRFEI